MGIERFSLRTFWFFKTQLVAFVWAVFILGIALGDVWTLYQITGIFIWFSAVFFLILALTIPFEIRDWKVDKLVPKLKTIPMVFGLKGTLVLSLLHLILSLLIFLLFDTSSMLLIPLFTIMGIIIYSLNQDSHEYKYTLVLDGLIILVYPLLLLGKQLI
jgi:4-hydroxybenzoate polyprenyltransferase